jgi:predicted nucleotidyltransferase
VQELAVELGAEERTLRRAVMQGTLRAERPGPRRLRLAAGEGAYLREHWPLFAELRRALRTQRHVRLAVLYGSVARGDEDEGSDLDLLISTAGGAFSARVGLAGHLQPIAARRIDVAHLDRVEVASPLLLNRILDEGRVLIDRDGQWKDLRDRRRAIRARAGRAYGRQIAGAARAIAELTQ